MNPPPLPLDFDEFAPQRGEYEASIDEQLRELEAEIRTRRRVFPAWVRQGKMSDETARRRIGCLLSARRTLITARARAGGGG